MTGSTGLSACTDRERAAGMLNRFSSALANVERALRALDEDCYGNCIRCASPIAVKRLQTIPWAASVTMPGGDSRQYGAASRRRISMSRRRRVSRSSDGVPIRSADDFGTCRRKSADARKCLKAIG